MSHGYQPVKPNRIYSIHPSAQTWLSFSSAQDLAILVRRSSATPNHDLFILTLPSSAPHSILPARSTPHGPSRSSSSLSGLLQEWTRMLSLHPSSQQSALWLIIFLRDHITIHFKMLPWLPSLQDKSQILLESKSSLFSQSRLSYPTLFYFISHPKALRSICLPDVILSFCCGSAFLSLWTKPVA